MREVEIKLKVNNLEEIEKKLKDKGVIFSKPVTQHDIIYSNTQNKDDFDKAYEGHVAIRIRYQNDAATLTLKKQLSYEMDNLEYESEIKNANDVHKILSILGWKPEVEVKKTRKKGKLEQYKICLDKVEKLGNYIELEKLTQDYDNPEDVRKELFKALEPLGFSEKDEETKGYDTLIYQMHKK